MIARGWMICGFTVRSLRVCVDGWRELVISKWERARGLGGNLVDFCVAGGGI